MLKHVARRPATGFELSVLQGFALLSRGRCTIDVSYTVLPCSLGQACPWVGCFTAMLHHTVCSSFLHTIPSAQLEAPSFQHRRVCAATIGRPQRLVEQCLLRPQCCVVLPIDPPAFTPTTPHCSSSWLWPHRAAGHTCMCLMRLQCSRKAETLRRRRASGNTYTQAPTRRRHTRRSLNGGTAARPTHITSR
jgi:hypothetical protein